MARIPVYCIRRRGRNYGLRWHDGVRWREITSGTRVRREAERAAAALEARLDKQPLAVNPSWPDFRARFEAEYLPALSLASRQRWETTAAHVERVLSPRSLSDLCAQNLSRWIAALQQQNLASASIQSYWATLHAAMAWARDQGLIAEVPRVRVPGLAVRRSRGRGITSEELERILAAAAVVRPRDAAVWRRLISGLYWSGLRVGEALRLSWELSQPIALVPPGDDRPYPLIRFAGGSQKSGREQWLPVLPEFWSLVTSDSPVPGTGWVFPVPGAGSQQQMTIKRVVRTISAIGAESGVVVDPISGRTASSHDLGRRAFLTRLSERVSLPELKQWARHASIDTTLSYYAHHTARDLAATLWTASPGSPTPPPSAPESAR